MAFLRVLSGLHKGERVEIDRDRVVIGRSSKNLLCIDDPSVSGEHCQIMRDGRKFTLKDLGSTNGTRLNDVAVQEYELSAKDIIKVGVVEILFDGKDIDSPAETLSQEDTQVTVRLGAQVVEPVPTTSQVFKRKKRKKIGWPIIIIISAILAIAAMAFFLRSLFS